MLCFGMWIVGDVLSLLEGVEMGSLRSILLLCDQTEISVFFKHLQESTPGFVLILFFVQKVSLKHLLLH